MISTRDEQFMKLALAEAEKGLGRTRPNPAVGAVLVRDGEVLGRGYHHRAGEPHAELNALADARARGFDARGATLYVTLEPCNHTGRTPPCSQAVLAAGVRRVVLGALDPNSQVKGGGAAFLAENGVEVERNVLRDECRRLILPFAKLNRSGKPWVLMKAGLSLDGKISRATGQGGVITGVEAGRFVHGLRNRLDAILVGVGTALIDDPSLTCRLKGEDARDPLRVVLDTGLRLPANARMLQQKSDAQTVVFCGEGADEARAARLAAAGALVLRVPEKAGHLDLCAVLRELGRGGVASLLVEGGARVHGAFLSAGLVDEVALDYAPFFIGESGTPLILENRRCGLFDRPLLRAEVEMLGGDFCLRGYFTDPDSLFVP